MSTVAGFKIALIGFIGYGVYSNKKYFVLIKFSF